MIRMIERWFPCAEVSEASGTGWGSGNTERNLFTWFAARPTAQAKAAVITSLLPWPDDEAEQRRLQDLVRRAMTGRYEGWQELRTEIAANNPEGGSVLDPFSGRGMIPLEAARLGLPSHAIEYAPVAVLASELLIDYPFRDWSNEPELPFAPADRLNVDGGLLRDVAAVLAEISRRHAAAMADFYPQINETKPWGYLWAVTLPCLECGVRFPVMGNNVLRTPRPKKNDPGQSIDVLPEHENGISRLSIHSGPPQRDPTLVKRQASNGRSISGKSAVCPSCGHAHPLEVHRRLANEGQGHDELLAIAMHDDDVGKVFLAPTAAQLAAAKAAGQALRAEPSFSPFLTAVPDEGIAPGNNNIIGPSIYGARRFGDMMCDRQSLSFVRLARVIGDLGLELKDKHGVSPDYAKALCGYAGATLVRKLRYSTRGAWLRVQSLGRVSIAGIFVNEGSLTFSYDFFEAGIGSGGGSWNSSSKQTVRVLGDLLPSSPGRPSSVSRGSAIHLSLPNDSIDAVVADPPYDEMIAYADSSDLFYAWLKRCLVNVDPAFALTSDSYGAQEKTEEIIVKRSRGLVRAGLKEHRTREHYDTLIAESFREMHRVVRDHGIVTIVFGHGEPEVWHRLLRAITNAQLVLTGSWPAQTESGGQQGKANIVTTLTMSCRPAPVARPDGRAGVVESEVKEEVKARMPLWERSGLAPTDMLMASAGPAMEVVGRYAQVLDSVGKPVQPDRYLITARQAVQEAAALEIENHPLETFDARTRFALWWVRLYGRQLAAKSELRWQALAADLDLSDVRDLVPDVDKGCRLVAAKDFKRDVSPESSVIDVALALARAWSEGLDAAGEVLAGTGRDAEDSYLWGAIAFLADRIPDADTDSIAWTGLLRNRKNVGVAAKGAVDARRSARKEADEEKAKLSLF